MRVAVWRPLRGGWITRAVVYGLAAAGGDGITGGGDSIVAIAGAAGDAAGLTGLCGNGAVSKFGSLIDPAVGGTNVRNAGRGRERGTAERIRSVRGG